MSEIQETAKKVLSMEECTIGEDLFEIIYKDGLRNAPIPGGGPSYRDRLCMYRYAWMSRYVNKDVENEKLKEAIRELKDIVLETVVIAEKRFRRGEMTNPTLKGRRDDKHRLQEIRATVAPEEKKE